MGEEIVHIIDCNVYDALYISSRIEQYIDPTNCKKIFIKPNMVIDPWRGEEDDWIATVTNASLIEAVLMVLKQKVKHSVSVVIGDAPMARSNHEITLQRLKVKDIVKKYQSEDFDITLIDIREWYWKYVCNMCVSRKRLPGDPKGVKLVNLRQDSAFAGKEYIEYEEFDNMTAVSEFHNDSDNVFSVSASILEADLVINLPKLKTHRIAGITCAMKNLVGINSNKNCVPHNTKGSSSVGGDAFKDDDGSLDRELGGIGGAVRKLLRKKVPIINYCFLPIKLIYDKKKSDKEEIGYGMWYGNDTIWRSIVDLNRILLYSDKNGQMQDHVQRKYLCIVDAIISGEGEGPLHPTPIHTNMIMISNNPVAVDLVAAELMGYDWNKIPALKNALDATMRFPLTRFFRDEVKICNNGKAVAIKDLRSKYAFQFTPTAGWKGHIEK